MCRRYSSVEGADEATIYVSIATNFNNYLDITANQIERAKAYLSKSMDTHSRKPKKNHIDFYPQILNQSNFRFG